MNRPPFRGVLLALAPAFLLSGCTLQTTSSPSSEPQSFAISGHVHGGQQPVSGAHVYLFGVRGDQNSVSRSLLGNGIAPVFLNPAGYGTDSSGNDYVITDANGDFTFNGTSQFSPTSTYVCSQNQLVYALAVGGNPGLAAGTNNTALTLMADLGPCMGNSLPATLNVNIDEVSTVAAAYALSGYMTGPLNVGYDNTLAGATGITNASANVNQLVNLNTGFALTATPNGNGIVPTMKLNTLANIISACVNTSGPASSACNTLFANATSDGTSTGTRPTDTLTAALNIAHHPAANVTTLFGIAAPNSPFQPSLPSVPNDLTLSIAYSGGGLNSPSIPAVDASGNVWFPNTASNTVTELSPLGVPVTGSPYTTSGSRQPYMVAIDPSGNAWLANLDANAVTELGPTGTETSGPSGFTGGGFGRAPGTCISPAPVRCDIGPDTSYGIAVDTSGSIVLADYTEESFLKFNSSGVAQSGNGYYSQLPPPVAIAATPSGGFVATDASMSEIELHASNGSPQQFPGTPNGSFTTTAAGGVTSPLGVAIDSSGNYWVANGNDTLTAINGSNTTGLTGSPFSGGGLNSGTTFQQPSISLAIDGANSIWLPNYAGRSISQFSNSGAPLSPSTGFLPSAGCSAKGLALDNAGDIWVSCDSATTPVIEFIGAATPVYTPLTPGKYGTKP
jgi:streptogramin lyase